MTETLKRDKRYNITGTIRNLEVKTTSDGTQYARFELARDGKKIVKAVAFAEKAAQLIALVEKSPIARVFGFFEKRSFTGQDGTTRISQRFRVLSAGEPKPAEAVAEAA